MNATFETLLSYLAGLVDKKLILLVLFISFVIFSFYYIKHKSKSGFSISNKLYMYLIGYRRDKNKNKERELIDDIIDVEKFNFHYNTNAVSKRQINRFEGWVRKYELDFKLLSKLKSTFDIESFKIKKITKVRFAVVFFCMFIPFVISFQTFFISLKPSLLVNVKSIGWFWINKDKASGFSFYDSGKKQWMLTQQACEENRVPENINRDVFKTICGVLSDKDNVAYVERNIKYQQYFFMLFTIMLCVISLILYRHAMLLSITYTARKMLLDKIIRYRNSR